MKKLMTHFCILVVLASFSSCSKSDTNPQSNSATGEYIEFKIDGQLYRMEEQQIGAGNTDFIVGAARHSGPTYGKYGLTISFAHSTQDEGASVSVIDNEPITKSHYDLSLVDFSSLVTYIMPNGNQYMISDISAGTIDFTSIDTSLNHALDATFQITNLELWDEDGNVISTGHTLTDGKIKTKVE